MQLIKLSLKFIPQVKAHNIAGIKLFLYLLVDLVRHFGRVKQSLLLKVCPCAATRVGGRRWFNQLLGLAIFSKVFVHKSYLLVSKR
jgi:hypothetical protein